MDIKLENTQEINNNISEIKEEESYEKQLS